MEPTSLQLTNLSAVDCVNFASAQNAVPILQSIGIKNEGNEDISNFVLEMTPHPPFCRAKSWIIDRISANSEISLSDLHLEYDFAFFGNHNEAEHGQLNLTLRHKEHILTEKSIPIRILARDEWGGLGMAAMLAAFVSPNDNAVAQICKNASILLEKAGHDGALNGYQTKNPKRAYMLAAGIWSAITAMALSYAEPPASFENNGQKVRSPGRIKEEGLATCLDSSLLFASALEAAGLNSVVIFTKGHAFSGVWLIDSTLPSIEETDIVNLRKAIAAREFVVFETTLVTTRPVSSFPHAIECARAHLGEAQEANFDRAVDIRRARSMGITPLASRRTEFTSEAEKDEVSPAVLPPEPDFGLLPIEMVEEGPQTHQGRLARWQRKLLDLTLRNRLLNFKNTKQTIPVLCPNLPKLEDILADGISLRVISLKDENVIGARDSELFRQQHGTDIYEEFAVNALERKQICIPLPGTDMRNRLITLYRKENSDLIEGGANTLYLAVGFLRWRKAENDPTDYRAPILLLPVSLKRRSAQSDFYLAHHEDDVRINLTLLQFLLQSFGIQISNLEKELPKDDAGIDVPFIFEAMRRAVRDVPGFEVVEEAALSTFSFAKYLMWKDLVDRADDLRNNRLVKHLIDAPETPFIQNCDGPCLPLPSEIDRRTSPQELLTPLPADSSQLAAVIAAKEGHDFIVVGPPGTGKSQTIANMIAQCLSIGKRVLFVAEKSAALDVVYRRLKKYGLGDACLELHSNKADRKKVLDQLNSAWERHEECSSADWQAETSKLKEVRDHLNQYVEDLHAPGSHGFSIFQAIGFVVDQSPKFALTFADVNAHDNIAFSRLADTTVRATRAYAIIGKSEGFTAVNHAAWSFAWEKELLESAEALLAEIPPLKDVARELSQFTGITGKIGLEQLNQLSRLYDICETTSNQDFSQVFDAELNDLKEYAADMDSAIVTIRQSRASLTATYDDAELKRIPVDDIDRQWREANSKMWPFSAFHRRKVAKILRSYTTGGVPDVAKEIAPLREIQCKVKELENNDISKLPIFDGESTDINKVYHYLEQVTILQNELADIRRHACDSNLLENTIKTLFNKKQRAHIIDAAKNFYEKLVPFKSALGAFFAKSGGKEYNFSLDDLELQLLNLIKNKSRLSDWTQWIKVRDESLALGLSPLLDALRAGKIENPKHDFYVAYFTWWLPLAIDASAELRSFRHWSHEDLIKEFKERDEAVQKLTAGQVLTKTTHKLPKRNFVPRRSELGTLKHQIGLQRPSLSIRKLIESMPTTFTQLAPCMLMSPLSVAQYLPSNQAQFDIIIGSSGFSVGNPCQELAG